MFKNVFKIQDRKLAQTARELAFRLDEIADGLHIKSDEHTLLLWEADILRAKADDIERKCGVIPNLRTSVLLPNSSSVVLARYSKIVDQVRAFHGTYDERARLP